MTPYFSQDNITIFHADYRDVLSQLLPVALVITDPPYGETDLVWDRWIRDFPKTLLGVPKSTASFWCFGSFRMFFEHAAEFHGWRFIQDVIWEKHNGSNNMNDRFRRVHETCAQFIPESVRWRNVYKNPQFTYDATARRVVRSQKPAHWRGISKGVYESADKGPRLQRSVIYARSMHRRGSNPTQKPEGVIAPLIQYSCPPGETLLDPCMGSGAFLMTAKKLGRAAIGVDIREQECEAAARMLSQKVMEV